MIDHDLIIAYLQGKGIFRLVGSAADAAATMKPGATLGDGPNAYVVPLADNPRPPTVPGGPQSVISTFGVVIMVRSRGDALGGATMATLTPLQQSLHGVLHGWQPAPQFGRLWLGGGRLVDFTANALWWMEEFSSNYGVIPDIVT